MMIVQELKFVLGGGAPVWAYLGQLGASAFEVEVLFPPAKPSKWSTMTRVAQPYARVEDAYNAAVSIVEIHAKGSGKSINVIDNPCNTPFIDRVQQKHELSQAQRQYIVKVNGR